MMTYKEYKAFWDNFLQKWWKNPVDFIMNDPDGQAFFPKNSQGNLIQTDLYRNITYMPEPYYFGDAFLNATDWSDFNDAIVVLDLNQDCRTKLIASKRKKRKIQIPTLPF